MDTSTTEYTKHINIILFINNDQVSEEAEEHHHQAPTHDDTKVLSIPNSNIRSYHHVEVSKK